MSKATKKTAKKATKKVVKKTAAPVLDTPSAAPAPQPAAATAAGDLAAMLSNKPKSPQEAQEQLTAMLRRLITEGSRHDAQIQYLGRSMSDSNMAVGDHMQYLESCLRVLFEQMHLDMPKRQPAIVDAKVELVSAEDLKDEPLAMRAAYSAKPHPVRGNYEILVGDDAMPATKLHPKVLGRLIEAFEKKIEDKTIEDGEFYYVRIYTIHNEPVGENSIKIESPKTEPVQAE